MWHIKTKYYHADVQFVAVELDLKMLSEGISVDELVSSTMDRVRGIDLVEAFIYYFESEEVSSAHC